MLSREILPDVEIGCKEVRLLDEVIKRGVHEWLDSMKEELGTLASRSTEEKIKLEVLKARKEIAEEAVENIEDSILREKFYNKYVNEINEEIKKCSNELELLRNQRKELNTCFNVLQKSVDASSYR